MGEYVIWKGNHAKIGTCEDLYYVRFGDLVGGIESREVTQASGNLPPVDYLLGDFRFRFPFPDEDSQGPGYFDFAYERGVLVPWPETVLQDAGDQHYRVYAMVKPRDAASDFYNLQVSLPCPLGNDAESVYTTRREPVLSLHQQRPVEGRLWGVVACPYCHARWRLDCEAAQAVAEGLRAFAVHGVPEGFYPEIARRLLAGYEYDVSADLQRLGVVSDGLQESNA